MKRGRRRVSPKRKLIENFWVIVIAQLPLHNHVLLGGESLFTQASVIRLIRTNHETNKTGGKKEKKLWHLPTEGRKSKKQRSERDGRKKEERSVGPGGGRGGGCAMLSVDILIWTSRGTKILPNPRKSTYMGKERKSVLRREKHLSNLHKKNTHKIYIHISKPIITTILIITHHITSHHIFCLPLLPSSFLLPPPPPPPGGFHNQIRRRAFFFFIYFYF